MTRILLLVQQPENRQMLNAWLSSYHSIAEPVPGQALDEPFDLCVVDGPSFAVYGAELHTLREAEQPGILPVLLLTSQPDIWASHPNLWQSVDDAVVLPASKAELQARIEILLRARRISLELRLRNEDMEAFLQAMSHDLRASIRAVTMFTETVAETQRDRLDEEGRGDIERIRWAAQEMREMIDSLLNFSRLGRGEIRYQPIDLKSYIETCLRNLESDIRVRNAQISIKGRARTIQADPTLLKIALTNLLSNAIKFVPEDRRPDIVVSTTVQRDTCRVQVEDNGIGISKEDQQRIFMPFVRLSGEEEFPGIGLGLPSVRKAMELMGGRVGVESALGRGSRFWIEFVG